MPADPRNGRGDDAAPPLVLLHGALGAAAQLAPLCDALRARDGDDAHALAIHAIDFAGHGAAAMRGDAFRIATFVDDVLGLLDALGVERASFFGYSMGGYVALALAAREPRRVERVMTLGTKFRWSPEYAERETRMLDARRMEEKVPHFARALAARHTGAGWEMVLDRTGEMMRSLGARPDLDDGALRAIAAPVRIAVGDRDATVSVEESAEVSRLLPAGELEVLPRTPHPLERVSVARLARSAAEFVHASPAGAVR